jgi:hypothetical protein
MGTSETPEHLKIKQILADRLKQWFGVSIKEYPSAGHELDVFSTSVQGVSVYFEIIWSDSRSHFLSDLNMVQQSDAEVKLVIGSPKVTGNENFAREFSKAVIAQRRIGYYLHGDIIDGQKILADSNYVETELKSKLLALIEAAKRAPVRLKVKHAGMMKAEKFAADKTEEQLLSNLFPVSSLPDKVFSCPTEIRDPLDIVEEVGQQARKIPFIVRRGRIYCFFDIGKRDFGFDKVLSGSVSSETSAEWVRDQDRRNWLMELLNQAVRKYCRNEFCLEPYERRERFFFPPKDGRDRVVSWKTGKRTVDRTVAKAIKRSDGTVNFWFHRAIGLSFILIGGAICLKIEPGVVFTENGRDPFLSRRIGPLTTRWMKREFNAVYLDHVRFWLSYLSKQSERICVPTGAQNVEISTDPITVGLNAGIAGDIKNLEQLFEVIPEDDGFEEGVD